MKFKTILVTGEPTFIRRRQFLLNAMSPYFERIESLPSNEFYEQEILNSLAKILYRVMSKFSISWTSMLLQKNSRLFITKSQRTERKIRQLDYTPDLVFHIFGLFSPFWKNFDIPYTIYLDYTMMLAERNWAEWAPFINSGERDAWIECERKNYHQAYHIFTLSSLVKTSLIEDYGLDSQKITVVGSAANFQKLYEGEKQFGSQQILFNGSEFERKGGKLVVAAFKKVRQILPEAKLVIIGKKLNINEDGIENPGRISDRDEMLKLFLKTDLVVAPSYCDPFPIFVMEAMNYGVPCIVSDNDGMPEIVDDRVNGLVISQPTPDILAQRIVELLSNTSLLASMSLAARQKVKTKFNWDRIAENIVQVLST